MTRENNTAVRRNLTGGPFLLGSCCRAYPQRFTAWMWESDASSMFMGLSERSRLSRVPGLTVGRQDLPYGAGEKAQARTRRLTTAALPSVWYAPTFWGALLLGRLLAPVWLRRVSPRALILAGLLSGAAGIGMLPGAWRKPCCVWTASLKNSRDTSHAGFPTAVEAAHAADNSGCLRFRRHRPARGPLRRVRRTSVAAGSPALQHGAHFRDLDANFRVFVLGAVVLDAVIT